MALTKQEKQALCERMRGEVGQSNLVLFAGFRGLAASEVFQVKKKMKSSRNSLCVVKNSLLKKVLDLLSLKVQDSDFWKGETMMLVTADSDFIPAAKAVAEWSSQTQRIKIKGGILPQTKRWLSEAEVRTLAALPGATPLRVQLVSLLASPLSLLSLALEAMEAKFLLTLKAIENSKAKEGGTDACYG